MALEVSILKVTMIPQLGFDCIISLQSKPSPIDSVYQLTVSRVVYRDVLPVT